MTLRVRVTQTSPRIRVSTDDDGRISSSNLTLVTSGLTGTRLDSLEDVYETGSPEDGSTLVYNPNMDRYEVRKLDYEDLSGNVSIGDVSIDGGTF